METQDRADEDAEAFQRYTAGHRARSATLHERVAEIRRATEALQRTLQLLRDRAARRGEQRT